MDLCKKKESAGSTEDLERQYGRTWIWTITTVRKIFFFTGENLNTSQRPENPLLGFLLL